MAAGDEALEGASDAIRSQWDGLKADAETASKEGVTNVSDALIEATSDLAFDTTGEESEQWQAVQTALEEAQTGKQDLPEPRAPGVHRAASAEAEALPLVGKTSSIADVVKTVYRELISGEEKDYRIPGIDRGRRPDAPSVPVVSSTERPLALGEPRLPRERASGCSSRAATTRT